MNDPEHETAAAINGGGENAMDLNPVAEQGVHSGFPSPAQDYMNPCIDLNRELVRHPSATFYGRAVGDALADAGVEDGDVLVIDRALEPADGKLAVCFVDGEFTLKYISTANPSTGERDGLWLLPAGAKKSAPMKADTMPDFTVWGIVTYIIKKVH